VRSKNATAPLDHVFYALSDPTRRRILSRLSRAPANVSQLTAGSKLTFAAVAKHLRVLERGRLVSRRRSARDRRAVIFELRPAPLRTGASWLDKHRRFWEARFDDLERFVEESYRRG
jgi:DNA-binding transcriptional ArsR family regulator